MYVCLCNGCRDSEIREIADSGVRCAPEDDLALGDGPCCGTCPDCAQDIEDAVHGDEVQRRDTPAYRPCLWPPNRPTAMHLWRNLPDGQFLAVLRWLRDRGGSYAGSPAPQTSCDLAAKEIPPATR